MTFSKDELITHFLTHMQHLWAIEPLPGWTSGPDFSLWPCHESQPERAGLIERGWLDSNGYPNWENAEVKALVVRHKL